MPWGCDWAVEDMNGLPHAVGSPYKVVAIAVAWTRWCRRSRHVLGADFNNRAVCIESLGLNGTRLRRSIPRRNLRSRRKMPTEFRMPIRSQRSTPRGNRHSPHHMSHMSFNRHKYIIVCVSSEQPTYTVPALISTSALAGQPTP